MFFQETQGKPLQYGITAACGAGFLLFGYDQGVFGGLLNNEPFLRTFGYPGATIQGQIVATYDIGCIIGTLVSMFAGDKLGRRRSILIGCCILLVGAVLQTASYSLAQMIVGRVVAGVGNGMNTIAIPIWQAETARPTARGKLIVAQLVTNIFGIVITNASRCRPKYMNSTADCFQVDEFWVYLYPTLSRELAVPASIPMRLRRNNYCLGSRHARVAPLACHEESGQRGTNRTCPTSRQAE